MVCPSAVEALAEQQAEEARIPVVKTSILTTQFILYLSRFSKEFSSCTQEAGQLALVLLLVACLLL